MNSTKKLNLPKKDKKKKQMKSTKNWIYKKKTEIYQ